MESSRSRIKRSAPAPRDFASFFSLSPGTNKSERMSAGPHHGEGLVENGIVVIAAARDRLRPRRVEEPVPYQALVDVNADHQPDDHVPVERPSRKIVERHDLHDLAFHR